MEMRYEQVKTADLDTRSRILDVAEVMFTEHGFEATTLRMLTGQAESNLAAVSYHFGSKEALIQEVFHRRLKILNVRLLKTLDQLEQAAGPAGLRPSKIVEAFFGQMIQFGARGENGGHTFMRLLGRTFTEPNVAVRDLLAREYATPVARYKAALFASLPNTPRDEVVWRLHFMLGAMSYAMSGADAMNLLDDGIIDTSDAEGLHQRLMSFLIGGLRAPLSTAAGMVKTATKKSQPSTPKVKQAK